MERFLNRLERRYGRYALGNLTYILVGLQCLGFALGLTRPDLLELLYLDAAAIRAGELWRLFSWLAIPVSLHPVWVLFALFWLYTMGTALEGEWGAFRYQLYWLIGIIGTAVVAVASGQPTTNADLILSLFLAFATLWPDYELRIFFILPVPVKWLALLDAAFLAARIGMLPGWARLLPLVAIANYLLFFGPALVGTMRRFGRHAARSHAFQHFKHEMEAGRPGERKCAICGKSNRDPSVDLRVCSCERCGGVLRDLCLEHARNH